MFQLTSLRADIDPLTGQPFMSALEVTLTKEFDQEITPGALGSDQRKDQGHDHR